MGEAAEKRRELELAKGRFKVEELTMEAEICRTENAYTVTVGELRGLMSQHRHERGREYTACRLIADIIELFETH